MSQHNDDIVIVGSGLAAYGVVRELRKLDQNVSITVVTQDDGAFYSKPRLSNHLSSGRGLETLVNTSGKEMAEKNSFQLLAQHEITGFDREQKLLHTNQGEVPYGKLVLALGASAREPSYTNESQKVFSVNHLDDYLKFHTHLKPSSKVVIYGGGLVACEFANDLAVTGHDVHMIVRDTSLLGRLVGSLRHRISWCDPCRT